MTTVSPEGRSSTAQTRSADEAAVGIAEASLQRIRSWTGLIVVVGGDVTIAVAPSSGSA